MKIVVLKLEHAGGVWKGIAKLVEQLETVEMTANPEKRYWDAEKKNDEKDSQS